MPSNTAAGTPFGLSSVCSRNGGMTPSSEALRTAAGAVSAEIPRDLAGSHREAGEHDVLVQGEMVEQRFQVAREGVVVEAGARLARLPEAAPVIADAAILRGEQRPLLAFPRVAVEWIAVDQDDRYAGAMVVVVDVDVGAVLAADLDEWHCRFLSLVACAGARRWDPGDTGVTSSDARSPQSQLRIFISSSCSAGCPSSGRWRR